MLLSILPMAQLTQVEMGPGTQPGELFLPPSLGLHTDRPCTGALCNVQGSFGSRRQFPHNHT